ncbi:Acylphosphatase family protein [Cryptosporidium felis]|nr:Acylphosphatase family protein [Cryptosporidium felis]
MLRCEFEVFGRVQGVSFRKYTLTKANELGVFGWCKNSPSGTVVGELEGPVEKVLQMLEFLEKEGSPKSVIERCSILKKQSVAEPKFKYFEIVL